MESLFKQPYLALSPTSDLAVATAGKEPVAMGEGEARSEVPPTGATPSSFSAGDAKHRHAPEQELVVLAGTDTTDDDGKNGCFEGEDAMGSISPATWADPRLTEPDEGIKPTQDSARTASSATVCSGVVPQAVEAPLCAREVGRTAPLFSTCGSSSVGTSKSVNRSRAAEKSSMQSFDSEDPALMIVSHQNGCQDGSSSGDYITPEDWLHVAGTVLAHAKY